MSQLDSTQRVADATSDADARPSGAGFRTLPSGAERGGLIARLATIALAHGVVDFLSYVIVPILTIIEGRLSLSPVQGAILLATGSISSGLIQPAVAMLSDKHDTRVVGTIGAAVAAVAVGLIGYADSFTQILLIQILSTAGIGAFHPIAAAAMGQLSGARRSSGVAVFFAAGMLGGIGGNWTTPSWVARFGVESIVWFAAPGLVAAGLLAWAIHGVRHNHEHAARDHVLLSDDHRRGRWRSVWLLYAGNVVRFTVNMCLVQLLVRWSEQAISGGFGGELAGGGVAGALDVAERAASARINGPLQAAMQIGMGAGGLGLGLLLPRRLERAALVMVPVLGGAGIALFPLATSQAEAFPLAVAAGLGYAGVMPLTIAMAQRCLPHRTSLASGLMMGGAWSVAAVGPPLAQWMLDTFGMSVAFFVVSAMLASTGLLALPLKVEQASREAP
ncbi:MAG: MFS transporter [Planctomycetota bacterium]|nr:MFS transporter [Planctomycetota bacterium]